MDEPKRRAHPNHPTCVLCAGSRAHGSRLPVRSLRSDVVELVEQRLPGPLPEDATICRSCLSDLRAKQVLDRLERERGELSDLEREVAAKAAAHASIVTNVDDHVERDITFGQRVADAVARIGGSWSFVLGFVGFLMGWMCLNVVIGHRDAFDPYPFILLNLVLSCVAALQAPIIMMSQNRSAARDRRVADLDYRVNLKAELEIAALHEKIDHILHSRWDDLVALQQTQLDMLEELSTERDSRRSRGDQSK